MYTFKSRSSGVFSIIGTTSSSSYLKKKRKKCLSDFSSPLMKFQGRALHLLLKKNHLYLFPLGNIPDKNLFYNNILPLELLSSLFFSDVKRFFQSSMTRIKLIIMYNLHLTSQKYDLTRTSPKTTFWRYWFHTFSLEGIMNTFHKIPQRWKSQTFGIFDSEKRHLELIPFLGSFFLKNRHLRIRLHLNTLHLTPTL